MSAKKLIINGELRIFENSSENLETLAEILNQLSLPVAYAIAINGTFIPQVQYSIKKIFEGDELEIISPHPGG